MCRPVRPLASRVDMERKGGSETRPGYFREQILRFEAAHPVQ